LVVYVQHGRGGVLLVGLEARMKRYGTVAIWYLGWAGVGFASAITEPNFGEGLSAYLGCLGLAAIMHGFARAFYKLVEGTRP
jgi:hypothetical protein